MGLRPPLILVSESGDDAGEPYTVGPLRYAKLVVHSTVGGGLGRIRPPAKVHGKTVVERNF